MTATAFALLALCAPAQDPRSDDVIQRKDGVFLVGRIVKMEPTAIEILVKGESEARRVAVRDIEPYSVYQLKRDRIDAKNGQAHFDLGEFCMTHGLYSTAAREFGLAGDLEAALKEKASKRRAEAHNEDARSKFEEAKRLFLKKDYSAATKLLHTVLSRYSETPYHEPAKQLTGQIAAEIQKTNKEKENQLAQKKKDEAQAEAKKKQDQEKGLKEQVAQAIEDAGTFYDEALDHEPRNLTRADRAWRAAEAALVKAKRILEILYKSNDVQVLADAKALDGQMDALLVKIYYRLGRMWAVELAYPKALEWLNKGLKIPMSEGMERLYNEVLVEISRLKMRQRAAGRGF